MSRSENKRQVNSMGTPITLHQDAKERYTSTDVARAEAANYLAQEIIEPPRRSVNTHSAEDIVVVIPPNDT